jgi:hypothetical protein
MVEGRDVLDLARGADLSLVADDVQRPEKRSGCGREPQGPFACCGGCFLGAIKIGTAIGIGIGMDSCDGDVIEGFEGEGGAVDAADEGVPDGEGGGVDGCYGPR